MDKLHRKMTNKDRRSLTTKRARANEGKTSEETGEDAENDNNKEGGVENGKGGVNWEGVAGGEEAIGTNGEGVINTKLVLGKMANGKKLVGKILKIERGNKEGGGNTEAGQVEESGGDVVKETGVEVVEVERVEGRFFAHLI